MLKEIIENVYQKHLPNRSGEVAQYIPELAKADPEPFGIAIATVNGDIVEVGDTECEFSIQSLSKPFVFGKALEVYGPELTYQHVGVEPSGDAFNSTELNPDNQLPYNPMVNSGAISMSALIHKKYGNNSEAAVLDLMEQLSGRRLSIDEDVYRSELDTAFRNRALANLMRGAGVIDGDVDEKVALYTRQCSIEVNARDLAVMALTLANFGTNVFTKQTVYNPLTTRNVTSVMFMCGMYNFAGKWNVDVGLPAKSGVSGGVMAVVNRQMGIGIFSPRLDPFGNSVRATAACISLAEELGLHVFEFSNKGSSMLDIYL